MPSGQTHDRITLWSLPVVMGLTLVLTRSSDLTLLVSGGFLFSGLMLSPDLDLYSRPFKRWGWLRWIWIPYQKGMRHRSMLSHGPIIGTTLRIVYLASWIVGLGVLGLVIIDLFRDVSWSWQQVTTEVIAFVFKYCWQLVGLFAGLEMGAMTHSLSDWTNSAYKRWQRARQKSKGLLSNSKSSSSKPRTRKPTTKTQRQKSKKKKSFLIGRKRKSR
ncbi:DUF2227 family putative metal-binding protein [Lyngbya aestuarii]|uniref:DUF2227 family putative metal-binding protein n=1 Tax=Lyngbya aestuarii TaxID=118322 RepID=UPI00403D7513